MIRLRTICAVLAMLSLPSWARAADVEKPKSDSQAPADQVFGDIQTRIDDDLARVTQPELFWQRDLRFGWWSMWHSGSPAKVGEYQDLNPSPFWDVDAFSSNGARTLGITATGTDQETTLGKIHYYQPGVTVDVGYQSFLHELDHDPLDNMQAVTNPSTTATWPPVTNPATTASNPSDNPKIIKEDLGAGQDYAIRVRELKGSFKWTVNDDVKVRLDVWGMEKDGTRQVNAEAMCYNAPSNNTIGTYNYPLPPDHLGLPSGNLGPLAGKRCHVLSQPQQIDWVTREIKPVVEIHLSDSLVLEYSRPMRAFTADDGIDSRYYDRTGNLSYDNSRVTPSQPLPQKNPNPYAYAVAPNSVTQMDQLKLSGRLNEENRVYAFLMAGSAVNQEINMNRWFNDSDVRWTNTSLQNVTLTGYGTIYNEAEEIPDAATVTAVNQGPATALGTNTQPTQSVVAGAMDTPINYHKSTAGLKGVWRVDGGGYAKGGLAITGGYEYADLDRQNAIYDLAVPAGGILDESHTITHCFQVGPDYRWSTTLDTYLHYKFQDAIQPLLGVQEENGIVNTLLPQHDHIVEMGFNWMPSDSFMFNACVGIERGDTHGTFGDAVEPINFDEENYPMSFTGWWAVNPKWSLSAGYAIYSNFVAQTINVADESTFTTPGSAAPPSSARWSYGGRAHVLTVGSRYDLTERVTLTADGEWVRGHDLINDSTITLAAAGSPTVIPGGTISDLGGYSEVSNESSRLRVGADWKIRPRIVVYTRYELYYFHDIAPGYQSGLAQGVLGGISALY